MTEEIHSTQRLAAGLPDTVSFTDWWNSHSDQLALLDLRSSSSTSTKVEDVGSTDARDSFLPTPLQVDGAESSIQNRKERSIIVKMSFEELDERRFELPPRNTPFAILLEGRIATANDLMDRQTIIGWFLAGGKFGGTRPWRIQYIVEVTSNEEELMVNHLIQTSHNYSKENDEGEKSPSFSPLPRLWQPDSMIQNQLWPLLRESLSSTAKENEESATGATIWDLGSGAGRDVAFLAEECKRSDFQNVTVCGIDCHKGSSKRCLPFWARRGVSDMTATLLLDLNKIECVEKQLEALETSAAPSSIPSSPSPRPLRCVYAVRFWSNRLARYLSSSKLIQSGTFLAWSQFCLPHDGASWPFPHPSLKHVLQRNELQVLFQPTWDVIHNEISPDNDGGRTLIHFIARKR